jgi:phosphoenolpyruvate carboxykinase (GTP)
MPRKEDLVWEGLKGITPEQFHELMSIDTEGWKEEISSHEELFSKLYDKLPKEFIFMRELILSSLWRSPKTWDLVPDPT